MTDEQQPTDLDFETAMERLDALVHDLEEGKLGLGDSLGRYEEGVRLLRHCAKLLEGAERKIELLSGVDAAGNPTTTPFADTAAGDLEEKGRARSRRRTAGQQPDAPECQAGN